MEIKPEDMFYFPSPVDDICNQKLQVVVTLV